MRRRHFLQASLATGSVRALGAAGFDDAFSIDPTTGKYAELDRRHKPDGTAPPSPYPPHSPVNTYANAEEFKASTVESDVINVSTLGFYDPGDGGGAVYTRTSRPSIVKAWHLQSGDGAWWKLFIQDVSLLHFGVRRGSYGTDNSIAEENTGRLLDAVEWLLARGDSRQRVLRSPEGTIELMDFSLPEEATRLTFIGTSWNNSVWLFKNTSPGVGCTVASVEVGFWSLQFLQYTLPGKGNPTIIANRTLLRLQRPPRPELPATKRFGPDLDGTVMFCKFSHASVAIEAVGRGLRAESNLFSICDRCIKLGWGGPNDYRYGEHDQSFQAGYRAFQLQNNRYHSYRYAAVTNDGEYADKLQGILISGSYSDIGRPIFDGVLIDGLIDALVTQSTTEALRLRHGSKRYLVSGNFSGSLEAERTPEYLIRLFGDHLSARFGELTLSNSEKYAIFHDGTVNGVENGRTGSCTGLDIDGVMFANVCTNGDEFTPIALLGEGHEGVVRNVALVRAKPLAGLVRTSASSTSISVSNFALLGGADKTPPHIGPGGRYGIEYVEELRIGSDGNGRIMRGSGSPADTISAPPGSIYLRSDGSTDGAFFVKVFGHQASGWYSVPLSPARRQ